MTKTEKLTEMIGKEVSCEQSPTLCAKLIAVYDTNCLWEVTPNQWSTEGNEMVGSKYLLPSWLSKSMLFVN